MLLLRTFVAFINKIIVIVIVIVIWRPCNSKCSTSVSGEVSSMH